MDFFRSYCYNKYQRNGPFVRCHNNLYIKGGHVFCPGYRIIETEYKMDRQFTFEELHAVVAALRGENGCPWDKAQTHESMKGNTIEEAYEVNQAVSDLTATGNPANLCEELGDLLLQVMLHSQIAEESGEFTLEDVIDGITRKMIRRHPHVFGGETYESDEERRAAWETIKEQEHREAQAAAAQSGPGDSGRTTAPSGLADAGRTTAQSQSGDAGSIASSFNAAAVASWTNCTCCSPEELPISVTQTGLLKLYFFISSRSSATLWRNCASGTYFH